MENWKDIRGFEGRYQISDCGRMRRLAAPPRGKNGKIPVKELMIKPKVVTKGYLQYRLGSGGVTYRWAAHRLVLSTFSPIDGWEDLQVNHKDGDVKNNKLSNLEWCSPKENAQHAYSQLGRSKHAWNSCRALVADPDGNITVVDNLCKAAKLAGSKRNGTFGRKLARGEPINGFKIERLDEAPTGRHCLLSHDNESTFILCSSLRVAAQQLGVGVDYLHHALIVPSARVRGVWKVERVQDVLRQVEQTA